jgi:hypothetical protein
MGACGKMRILLIVLACKTPSLAMRLYFSGRKHHDQPAPKSAMHTAQEWAIDSNAYAIRGKCEINMLSDIGLYESISYGNHPAEAYRDAARSVPDALQWAIRLRRS